MKIGAYLAERPHCIARHDVDFCLVEQICDLSPQLQKEIYKWNMRDLLERTPLLSGLSDLEPNLVAGMVGVLEASVLCFVVRRTPFRTLTKPLKPFPEASLKAFRTSEAL